MEGVCVLVPDTTSVSTVSGGILYVGRNPGPVAPQLLGPSSATSGGVGDVWVVRLSFTTRSPQPQFSTIDALEPFACHTGFATTSPPTQKVTCCLLLVCPLQPCNNTTPCPVNCTGSFQVLNDTLCTGECSQGLHGRPIHATWDGRHFHKQPL